MLICLGAGFATGVRLQSLHPSQSLYATHSCGFWETLKCLRTFMLYGFGEYVCHLQCCKCCTQVDVGMRLIFVARETRMLEGFHAV